MDTGVRDTRMSEIYQNAVDSLRIGMEYFLRESGYSSRKHAILTLFHAIELFLKEQLRRTHPILIYKNIDSNISDDSITVGLRDILVRLDNIGVQIPKDQRAIVERIQARRNRIEHHRYDHREREDETTISEALKFILFFVELILDAKLSDDIEPELLNEIERRVYAYNEREGLAEYRFENWAKSRWPDWNNEEEDTPSPFEGTYDCPECRQSWLVIGYEEAPFCFFCNSSVEASLCEECGCTFISENGCCSSREARIQATIAALSE